MAMGTNRAKRNAAIGMALAMSAFVGPAPVLADVLQIGDAGAEWISGGPRAIGPDFDSAQAGGSIQADALSVAGSSTDAPSGVEFIGSSSPSPVAALSATDDENAPSGFGADLHPQSITEALDAAGPTRWRVRVAQLAAKYDISPALLEAVVWQESRWNELALSPVGARGLAQLMPGTAAQMGINPGDPMANLEGGARYLRMQLDAFNGNIEKALAAYNAGPGRVAKAGGIPNIRETRAYVASIMARLTDPVRQ